MRLEQLYKVITPRKVKSIDAKGCALFGWDTARQCLVYQDTGQPVGSTPIGLAVNRAAKREARRQRRESA